MKDYLMIGTVLRPQGVRGECKIRSWAANIKLYYSWNTLYRETASGYEPVSVDVTRIHDNFIYAHLNKSGSADEAEVFRGVNLFVHRSDAAPPEDDATLIEDLIGCEARDEKGVPVGTLTDVLQYGTVDTWVFRTESGMLMAPALKAVFPRVDAEHKSILAVRDRLEEVAVLS